MSKEDVRDKLENPPPKKLITDESGRFIKVMEINDVLQTPYRRCKTCSAKFRCSRVQKSGSEFLDVDCVIEKDALDVIMERLTLDGVTIQDELLVFPVIRNVIQLIRLYELETFQDLGRILRDEEAMKIYKHINGMIKRSEDQLVKYLKELTATRKEDQKKTVHTVKENNKKIDLAKKLGEKKKNADKQKKSKT